MSGASQATPANELVRLAAAAHKSGLLGDTIAKCREALVLEPNHPAALFHLGIALCQTHAFQASGEILRRAIALNPKNIQQIAMLAIAERDSGQPHEGTLARVVAFTPKSWQDVAVIMWAHLQRGEPEKAFAYRVEGLSIAGYHELSAFFRNPDLAARLEALPPLSGAFPVSARPVIATAADAHYAKIFARDFVGSALQKSPEAHVHLHIMNPDDFKVGEALSGFPAERVSWTSEDMPHDRTLYSVRRFLRLTQFLSKMSQPLIWLDADTVINGDILSVLPQRFDVMVNERRTEPFITQMINASFLAVHPGGADFAGFLASYILHFENTGAAHWFVDQLGLVAACEWFKRNRPEDAVARAPPHLMDWSAAHHHTSLIWHDKGKLKEHKLA